MIKISVPGKEINVTWLNLNKVATSNRSVHLRDKSLEENDKFPDLENNTMP